MSSLTLPQSARFQNGLIQVGLVGTGYAAKLRAEAVRSDSRAALVAVAGHNPEKTQAFSQQHEISLVEDWQSLVQRSSLDLIIVANVNREHGAIVRAALQSGKHVVVEYPLALDLAEAIELVALAKAQNKLLHVEHIELLGGVHQALKANLPTIGRVSYARYATLNPQHPAPQKWTYRSDLFGFPLMGALSRLHRLIDAFGEVESVSCQAQFDDRPLTPFFTNCLCLAQLRFRSGTLAEVVYGKGERVWRLERSLQVHGEAGTLVFEGETGTLIQLEERTIEVGSRRGMFGKDTELVLDHLTTGATLYVSSEASLYTLRVAEAAQRSAASGETIHLAMGAG